jgi:phage baseplate assembly protein W
MALIKQTINLGVKKNTNDVLYSDFYSDLDTHPDKKDLLSHINEESVRRSIKNILLTNRGERLFNPTFGSNLRSLLFENITPVTESLIREQIETSINNFEPRARLLKVLVTGLEDENAYNVSIVFTTINTLEPITMNVFLNRVR